MKQLLILVSLLTMFQPALVAMDTSLKSSCRLGAHYNKPDELLSPIHKEHCQKNIKAINDIIGQQARKTTVVLGPGPANDLDIAQIVRHSEKVVLIDGYLDVIQAKINSLFSDVSVIKKMELLPMDLTGGFYGLMSSGELEHVIENIVTNYLKTQTVEMTQYREFLQKNLVIDFSLFNPDVIISSLVASQLFGLSLDIFCQVTAKAILKACTQASQSYYQCMDLLQPLNKESASEIERAFFKGLQNSGAQTIYFSDTMMDNGRGLVKPVFDQFIETMKSSYDVSFCRNAWLYDEGKPVSWYAFTLKQ